MTIRRTMGFLGLALALLLWPAAASAQLHTGDVYGQVADDQKQPLPGVTLTLTGVGAPLVTQSDEQGRFRFTGLYPGEYSLLSELEGFSSVEQTGVLVKIGTKITLDVTLSAGVRETITVTAEHALVNPREHNVGPVLTPAELNKLPTARDPWSLLRQAPGVVGDRENIGGNESGQQSSFFVGGATSADNTFAVDGAIETDMAAVGGSSGYFDFGAYEEIQIITASTDVTVQTAGVTINQVTKRGTNTWKGDGRYLKTDGSLQAEASRDGFPEGIVGNEIDSVEEYGANIGGPLVQDHLWAWAAYGESDIRKLLGVTGQLDHTQLEDLNVKLNFQFGNNSGSVLFWDNDKLKFGRDGAFDRPPETTHDQTTPNERWKIEDTHVFGSNFTLSAQYATADGGFTLHPRGGDNNIILDEGGIWRGSFWVFDQLGKVEQYKVDANSFFDTGSLNHELKFGAGHREQENDSVSTYPGVGYAVLTCEGYGCPGNFDEDGNVIDPSLELAKWLRHNVAVTTEYDAAWVQDTLSGDRFTITAGLRYDNQTARNDANLDPGQPDVPGGLFPRIDFAGDDAGGLEWESIVPRVGVTYALGENRRTLLRGTYSQYAAQLGQWVPNLLSATSPYSYVYYYFTDANRNLLIDPDERASFYYYYVYNVNLADPSKSPNRTDPDLDPYMTDEVTLALQHAFANNMAVSATLSYRNTTDLLEKRLLIIDENGNERLATRDDYVFDGTDERVLPDGRVVGVPTFALREELSSTGGSLLTNGDRELEYWGINLGFEKPMANHWSLRGNFTYGESDLKTGPDFDHFDDPTDVISFGALLWGDSSDIYVDQGYGTHRLTLINSRWSFNLSTIYQVAPERPWGFDVAAALSGREGFPFAPSGSRSVNALQVSENLDDFRHPDVFLVDAGVSKDFKLGDVVLTARLDGFNLLDEQPEQQRNPRAPGLCSHDDGTPCTPQESLVGEYQVVERLSPRIFRWGITLRWR